jgi:gliding motility-associated-like protein
VLSGVGLYGSAVAIHGNVAVVGAPESDSINIAAGMVYVYEYQDGNWREMARLYPSDPQEFISFGAAVAVSAERIVVGASGHTGAFANAGIVYVYEKNADGTWHSGTESARVFAPVPTQHQRFGLEVSLWQDLLVVGAADRAFLYRRVGDAFVKTATFTPSHKPRFTWIGSLQVTEGLVAIGDEEDLTPTHYGTVFLYEEPLAGWHDMTETAILTPSNSAGTYGRFGWSLSVGNDGILVGAPWYRTTNGSSTGAAFLFTKPASGWISKTQDAIFTTSKAGTWNFGASVLLTDTHAFVGNPDGKPASVGLFEKKAGGWVSGVEDKIVEVPGGPADFNFGRCMAISGDNLLVGCPLKTDRGGAGKACLYQKPAGGWNALAAPSHTFTDLDFSSARAGFGYDMATDGNFAVVAAPADHRNGVSQGAVYVFGFQNNQWTKLAKLKASDARYGDGFAASVALKGDYVIVGSPGHDSLRADGSVAIYSVGAAYVFKKPAGGWRDSYESWKIRAADALVNENFGKKVAIDGSYAVITSYNTEGGSNLHHGKAFVYKNNATHWNRVATLTTAADTKNDYFGRSIAIDDNTIVIGSGRLEFYILDPSFAYVYAKPAGEWRDATETAVLKPSVHRFGSLFGYAVGIDEDCIIVGEPLHRGTAGNTGCAYLFRKPASGWTTMTETAKLTARTEIAGSMLGLSVAIRGNQALVGAPDAKPGRLYLYQRGETGWEDAFENQVIVGETLPNETYFGSSIALAGQHFLVGSINDNFGAHKKAGSVTPYSIRLPAITAVPATLCQEQGAVPLVASPAGGRWSGPGISDQHRGVFDPGLARGGRHKVYYRVNDCEIAAIITVTPELNVHASDSVVCVNGPAVSLGASPAGGVWSGPGIANAQTGGFNPALAQVGSHTVVYTLNGCRKALRLRVVREEVPSFSLGPRVVTVCGEKETVLSAGTEGTFKYRWQYSPTGTHFEDVSPANKTSACAAQKTGYYLLQVSSGCSTARDTVYVHFVQPPGVAVVSSVRSEPCSADRTVLSTPYEAGVSYQWYHAKDSGTVFGPAPGDSRSNAYTPAESGAYQLVAVKNTCTSTSPPYRVRIEPPAALYIPNVITPNGDGKNDRFVLLHARGTCGINIYNRWGQPVFQSGDYHHDWQGDDLPNGVYYYQVYSKSNCFPVIRGWVQLLR